MRDYYETLIDKIAEHLIKEDVERFKAQFSRQNLSNELMADRGSVSDIYCLSDDETQNNAVKPVREPRKKIIVDPSLAPENGDDRDWNELRMHKLIGSNSAPIFFEYEVETDTLTLHFNNSDYKYTRSVINNFIRNIELRSDWSIFHKDLKIVVELFEIARKGRRAMGEIRYRTSGAKNLPFRVHSVICAPAEDVVPPAWIIGAMTDIDDEAQARDSRRTLMEHIQDLYAAEGSSMIEIDIERDILYKLVRGEDGYERASSGVRFSEYENKRINEGTIAKEDAQLFKNIMQPSFLEKKTLSGNYMFEARIRPVGSDTYRWYSYTFARIGQTRRFIVMIRDVTDVQAARAKEFALKEQLRFIDYNERMLETMASLVEFRNVESGTHITHVKKLTRILLEDMANRSPHYNITSHQIDVYAEASIMHDIGKIVVPDYILNKPGKLTKEEFEIMKRHTTDGARIIEKLDIKGQEELMEYCHSIALHHHERYDGRGYPDGLVGDETPIGVQCVGLADVYDAIVSVRCYKEGMTHDQAVEMILNGESGTFNPRLLESFRICKDRMHALYIEEEGDYERNIVDQQVV